MPQARPSAPSANPVGPGEHRLTLIRVDELETPNLYREKEDDPETRTRWIWVFRSDAVDDEGKNTEYTHWTGPTYGDDRAALTELLDWIMPDADFDTKANVNTDRLRGNRYRAKIKNRTNKKGKVVPDLAFAEPDKDQPRDESVTRTAKVEASGVIDPDEIPF